MKQYIKLSREFLLILLGTQVLALVGLITAWIGDFPHVGAMSLYIGFAGWIAMWISEYVNEKQNQIVEAVVKELKDA